MKVSICNALRTSALRARRSCPPLLQGAALRFTLVTAPRCSAPHAARGRREAGRGGDGGGAAAGRCRCGRRHRVGFASSERSAPPPLHREPRALPGGRAAPRRSAPGLHRANPGRVSVPAEAFYQNHGRLYSMMKGKMGPSNVHLFTGTLCKELHEHMAHLGTAGTGDLMELVRHVMYPAVVNTLFGKGVCPTSQSQLREFEEHFWKYDEDFEYASQMPECLLRNWSKSKKWLLKLFEKVVSDAERTNPSETTSKTLLQHLLDNLQGKHLAPNYGLLMLWASQANAVPIAFWTLVFILSYPTVYKKVMEDLASVFGSAGKDDIEVSEEDLKNLPYVKWCTLEAIRLRSPGAITKKVIKPIRIQSFTIPAGDMLMLSPYWLHRNPKYFPDPEMFKPDRWKEANLEKNAFLDGFVAFGGGKHQCPGRWFAIMEIQLFVVLFLYKYQFVLLDAVPKECSFPKPWFSQTCCEENLPAVTA
ncbi:24-hydroxycholesterol 7-alpha-hydroxylase isoform X2 [Tympanuchus pallidicinctus]|uniref:24-hydroxycholesterol 7-alpha-hydroxylase isoform X2 n=1 Tax=Tympanuchus pallidicinctus TaxID=109042 RepID=UPI0022873453|nr:24-hydroxycholesterol 7-alpha-hydroxylase isoform X2 [Tympanuchus pallidicinctus]